MARIWVFVEEDAGKPSTIGLELLAAGRGLGEVTAVYLGAGSDSVFATLGSHGASAVLHADAGDRLPSGPLAAALAGRVASDSPDLILFGQAYTDRDVAGRLAGRLGVGALSNAVAVRLADGGVETDHEILGGTQIATAAMTKGPFIVLIRPKSYPAEESGGPTQPSKCSTFPKSGGRRPRWSSPTSRSGKARNWARRGGGVGGPRAWFC